MTLPVIYVDITTPEPSVYAQRLHDYYNKDYYQQLGLIQDSVWNGRKRLAGYAQVRTSGITIQEEDYKGHQIVVVGFHREYRPYLNPLTNEPVTDSNELDKSILKSEPEKSATYIAFGYKQGDSEPAVNITYSYQFAIIKGVFETGSFKETMKKAKKRIDLQAKIDAVRDSLIAIAPERFSRNSTALQDYVPYNAFVGDHVFIQAHGRLRKGIIVDTTGSRFIVGYVTPSNHDELKYKTLPLSRIYKNDEVYIP